MEGEFMKIIAVLMLGMTNCFAMNNPDDSSSIDSNAKQEFVQKDDNFTQEEQDLLGKISALKQSKSKSEKTSLVAQFLIGLCGNDHQDNFINLIRKANNILSPDNE